ncbi:MAG: c-type cytochrome [Planctomycetes bacterium]|nr:c-type cytochrome [Planctomycetota bacterium]
MPVLLKRSFWLVMCSLVCLVQIGLPKVVVGGPLVAPTPALSPAEQARKFHLPPGFEIQLVASEPDIQKPMNLNFDSRGRLWVSHSYEYPFPAKDPAVARDAVTILDGIGADGRATKITRFADKLNIPIGVLPLYDGREAIAWSIPHLWKLRDTDGDGVADQREIMFGAFDYVDTHGNQNALKMGQDGWIYACHGFRNDSKIRLKGAGNVVLALNSGNVYRFRPDGSQIEQVGWGQVNPFGSCFDPFGDFFTADCHSKPVSLVMRGGYIESFGKPNDGLGFTPAITGSDHGSTGIAGIVYYDAPQFPAEYRNNLFVGNVVTNRVHRDVPEWRGSTPWIEKPEDFLVCDDWWFHPVDLQIGPDGALYIADFYNCIIGHYEVDINHPRRDRHRGRIWRVVWKGLDGQNPPPAPAINLAALPTTELFGKLSDPNLTVRTRATNELTTRKDMAVELARQLSQPVSDATRAAHLIWVAFRAGQVPPREPFALVWNEPVVRANWLRAVTELTDWSNDLLIQVQDLLADSDPRVQRIAAEALSQHPHFENVSPLLKLWAAAPTQDTLLIHAVKLSLRNQLRQVREPDRIAALKLPLEQQAQLAEVALAVQSESAAALILNYVQEQDLGPQVFGKYLAHVARNVGESKLNDTAGLVQRKFAANPLAQLSVYQQIVTGLAQRGQQIRPNSPLGMWGATLARSVLSPAQAVKRNWSVYPLTNSPAGQPFNNPWGLRNRNCADGQANLLFFDSIVNGEHLTGILRSNQFTIPESLTFWLCGHNGEPGTNPEPVNHVRLKLATTGEVIAKQLPPRNDLAQKVAWDLHQWAGQKGMLEVVDADSGSAYAWLAVSRFEPPVVDDPTADFLTPDADAELAVKLVQQLKLTDLVPQVVALLGDSSTSLGLRIAAAQTAGGLDPAVARSVLERIVADGAEPASLRSPVAQTLGTVDVASSRAALVAAFLGAPSSLEQSLALALASTGPGTDALLVAIAAGKAPARLLQDPPVVERLKPRLNPEREQKIGELTAGIPAADERIRQLVNKRAEGHARSGAQIEKGAALFKTHCAACHRIGDQGQKVGPQLDGIGQRGIERLLEDVLDPNRNVDGAFRATIVVTKGGLTLTGLKLRDEGQVMVIVDPQGKEQRIPADDIEESHLSPISPMPSNFAETIPEADFHHLLAFLLSRTTAPPKEPAAP